MAIASRVDDEEIVNIQPNVLDQYNQTTYHFKLFMLSREAFRDGRLFDNKERVILAESGVTGIAIENVRINSVVGMTDKTQVGFALNFNFTIIQPFGADFIDRLFAASIELGIENYAKFPFFLELSFRARDVDSDEPLGESSRSFDNLVWMWPIHILKMDISINEDGSVYECEAVIDSNLAYSDQHGMIEKSVSIEAANFGEFASRITDELNERARESAAVAGRVPDEYSIVPEFDLGEALLVSITASKDPNRERTYLNDSISISTQVDTRDNTNESDDSKTIVQFHRGVDIPNAITAVLSSTDRFQKSVKNTVEASEPGPSPNRKQTFKELFRVTTDVEIIGYDDRRGDYARRFTYHVVPYTVARLIAGQDDLNLTTEEHNRRFNDLRRSKALNKVYNYIYTGRNDQILEFNIEFNMAWFAATPILQGISQQYYSSDLGRQQREATVDRLSDQKNNSNANERAARVLATRFQRAEEQGSSAASESPGVAEARTQARNFHVQSGSINPIADPEVSGTTATETDNLRLGADRPINAPALTPESRLAGRDTPSRNLRFVEDFSFRETLQDIKEGVTRNRGIPVSLLDYQVGLLNNYGVESSFHEGKTLFSSLFSQVLSAFNNDMIRINMTIKGDPYWLEPKPVRRGQTVSQVFDPSQTPDPVSTAFRTMENYFIFRTQVPREVDENTGLVPKFDSKSIINGVYGVISIEHVFAEGQFTQNLTAVRDPITDISKIRDINL